MAIIQNTFFSVATVFAVNSRNELLILRRSEWKKIPGQEYRPHMSHTPDFPGGIVGNPDGDSHDENERVRDGAARELCEETGIVTTAENLRPFFATTNHDKDRNRSKVHLFYLLKLSETPAVKLSWEHEDFWWEPIDAVRENYDLSPAKTAALDYLIEHRDIFEI